MIAKKNPRYNLERKRIFFFQAGLMIAGSFTLAAFNYSTPVEKQHFQRPDRISEITYEIEPRIIEEKPDPVVIERPRHEDNNQSNSLDVDVLPDESSTVVDNKTTPPDPTTPIGQPPFKLGKSDVVVIHPEDEIPEFVAFPAEYKGGYPAMSKFIQAHVDYPEDARQLGKSGKVYVEFVVEKDGSISNVKVKSSIYPSLDREAMRIVSEFPKWKPGEQNYGVVRSRVVLPINFVLSR